MTNDAMNLHKTTGDSASPSPFKDGQLSEQCLFKAKAGKGIWKMRGLDSSLTLYPSG